MDQYSREWERRANEMARTYGTYAPRIYPCVHCGGPVFDGYCCNRCGSSTPKGGGDDKS